MTRNPEEPRPFQVNPRLKGLAAFYAGVWLWAAYAPANRFDWFLENLLVVTGVLCLALGYRWFQFSDFSYLLITLFLVLHTVGSHYIYSEVPLGDLLGNQFAFGRNHYDRLVHFAFGLFIAYPVHEIFRRRTGIRGFWPYFLTFAIIVASSSIYEFLEWCTASILAPGAALHFLGTQGDVFDAQKDTGLAILGALIALALTAGLTRMRRPVSAP